MTLKKIVLLIIFTQYTQMRKLSLNLNIMENVKTIE